MVLRRRLILLAGAIVAVLMAFAAAAASMSAARERASRSEVAVSVAVEQTLQLASAYKDMETGQRGFIIGGSEGFLDPYRTGGRNIDRLQTLLLSNIRWTSPRSVPQLKAVIANGDAWRAVAAQEILIRRTRGKAEAESLIGGQAGKTKFDALRASLALMSTRLNQQLTIERATHERRAKQLSTLIFAMPVAVIVFLFACAALLNRWVLAPIAGMVRAVSEVSSGHLSTAVPQEGAPDIAELGQRVDAMRLAIVGRLQEAADAREVAQRSREAIEQNTILALQLRAELASELGVMPTGWTAAADLLPAEGWVAGDCYDVTLVSPHVLGLIVIDIAGHGAEQAIMALKSKEILRAALRVPLPPGEALALLAEQVSDMAPSFLTAFVALIDTVSGRCQYANAGHPPPLLAHHKGDLVELPLTGPILGAFTATWRTEEVNIPPGGKLAVYTDGLNEARNSVDEFYGMERLAALVITLPCEDAEPVIKACFDDLHAFSPARLVDDVTMVLICRACPE